MDSIHIGALLPAARKAIDEFLRTVDRDARVERVWWDFDELCGLWFLLKYAADTPERFPHGKWATLQRIEELIAEAIEVT